MCNVTPSPLQLSKKEYLRKLYEDLLWLKLSKKFNQSFKNPDKPPCIDLILTNEPNLFQHNNAFETYLSDFHLLTETEFKTGFQRYLPLDYKNFDNAKFTSDLVTGTSNVVHFVVYKSNINRHVPVKKKYIRANEAPSCQKSFTKPS